MRRKTLVATKFNLKLSEGDYADLLFLSEELGQPMADVVRDALIWYGRMTDETVKGGVTTTVRADGKSITWYIPRLEALRSRKELGQT